jgi:hypothetical protein
MNVGYLAIEGGEPEPELSVAGTFLPEELDHCEMTNSGQT